MRKDDWKPFSDHEVGATEFDREVSVGEFDGLADLPEDLAPFISGSLSKCFRSQRGEGEDLAEGRVDLILGLVWVLDPLPKAADFLEESHSTPHVLVLREMASRAEAGQPVEFGFGGNELLAEPLNDGGRRLAALDDLGLEPGPCEREESLGDGQAREHLDELRFDLWLRDEGLTTDHVPHPAPGTAIVDVTGAVAVPVLFARHAPSAGPAVHEANESEGVALGPRGIVAAELVLDAVELGLGHDGLVVATVEFAPVLDEAGVEGVPEDRVETPDVEGAGRMSARATCAQAQSVSGEEMEPRDAVGATRGRFSAS